MNNGLKQLAIKAAQGTAERDLASCPITEEQKTNVKAVVDPAIEAISEAVDTVFSLKGDEIYAALTVLAKQMRIMSDVAYESMLGEDA